jgi:heat shock protein HslJ
MSVSFSRIVSLGLCLLVALFTLTGCSSTPGNDDRNSRYTLTAFGNSGWKLLRWVSADGDARPVSANPPSLDIGYAGRISGNAGVNNYTANVHVSSGTLVWSEIATTRMAGSEEAMAVEARFLADLRETTRVTVRNGQLLLQGEKPLRLAFTRVR